MADLTSADLLSPAGPVESFLFPGEDSKALATRLTGYLTQAYADARVAAQTDALKKNALARAWALYLVYTAVYSRLSANPATITVTEKGGHGYTATQVQSFKDLAAQYLADFNGLLSLDTGTVHDSPLPGTQAAQFSFQW